MAKQTSVKSFFQASSSSSASRATSPCEASVLTMDTPSVESDCESNSCESDVESSPLHCPPKRKKRQEKRTFNEDWKVKYMMWPLKTGSVSETGLMRFAFIVKKK